MKQIIKKIVAQCLLIALLLPLLITHSFAASEYIRITSVGQAVDSITYNGITVKAIYAPYSSIPNYGSDPTYCCAAFVKKFYSQVYGITVYNLLKNGGGPLVSAGGSFYQVTSPQVGDIVHDTTENTHWAIVKNVSGSSVTLIEQNSWWESRTKAHVGRTVTVGTSGIKFYRYSNSANTSGPNSNIIHNPSSGSATTIRADSITQTSAILRGSVSSSGIKLTQCGVLLGTNTQSMTRLGYDSINTYGTTCFYSTEKYGRTLMPETTYYYQIYAVGANGKEYKGDIRSFTTAPCTNHVKGKYLWYNAEHPHYDYYTCALCGQQFRDTATNNMPSCKICNPDLEPSSPTCTNHVKGKYLWYAAEHPHYDHYLCAVCGQQFRDTTTNNVSSCEICNPNPQTCTAHVKGKYLWYNATHPHYDYYLCAVCGEQFRDTKTNNMPSCEICNPPTTVTVTTQAAKQISSTSAQLNGSLSVKNLGRAKITEYGMYLGTSTSNMMCCYKDTAGMTTTSSWIFVDTEDFMTLKPNTIYYYYFYVVVDGETINGSVVSFKTSS